MHFALTLRGVESALEAAERLNNMMIRHITLSLNPCYINA